MPHEGFSVVYSGASLQADLIKSLLEGSGIPAMLEDEFLGRMYPYAIPGGVKVLVPNDDFDEARQSRREVPHTTGHTTGGIKWISHVIHKLSAHGRWSA